MSRPRSGKCEYCRSADAEGMIQQDRGRAGLRFRHRHCHAEAMRKKAAVKRALLPKKEPLPIRTQLERSKEWYRLNKDRKREYDAKRREQKRHLYRAAGRRWQKANPGKKNAETNRRRLAIARRLPSWVHRLDLVAFYESAARVSRCLQIPHDVDHVIPLRGKNVSGLHVPGNLRVLPAQMNRAKTNHFSLSWGGIR